MRDGWLRVEERWAWEVERGRTALVAVQTAVPARKDSERETRVKGSTLQGGWGVRKRKRLVWGPGGGGIGLVA